MWETVFSTYTLRLLTNGEEKFVTDFIIHVNKLVQLIALSFLPRLKVVNKHIRSLSLVIKKNNVVILAEDNSCILFASAINAHCL